MARLIDTSVLITLERRGLWLDAMALPVGEPVALASITISELLTAVHRADSPLRRQRREAFIEAVIDSVSVLPFDLPSARAHARIWAHLAAIGQPIGERDLLIAATALAHGYAVLTENTRDFGRVPELVCHPPPW
jgi:predicted nucleic acid-binding protein